MTNSQFFKDLMSLAGPPDPSATPYGESNLYSLKSSNNGPTLSGQIFGSNKRSFKYGPESYWGEIYNQEYPNPTVQEFSQQVRFVHPTHTLVPDSLFFNQGSPSYQLMTNSGSFITTQDPYNSSLVSIRNPNPLLVSEISHQSCDSDSLEMRSEEFGISYDTEEIRLKLQELERELLGDNDDDLFGTDQEMIINGEWTEPINNLINSPRESSSDSDSNLSSISSSVSNSDNRETLVRPLANPCSFETRTPKRLLFDCATAISEGNLDQASAMITDLRQMVSIQGDPPQRIAAYMVEGLAARLAASGQGLYRALKCKEPPNSDRLSAMQILVEVCPCFKFGLMAANGAIAEAIKDEKRVHIIDFDINQGSQYITLIQDLASQMSKPLPHLRITGVDDPESVQRVVGGLRNIGQRLEKLAEAAGVPFEFQAIPAKISDVTPSMLGYRDDEAVVVNFAFQLHHMPDESVSTVNQRDRLLRMVKSLKPRLVTVVEQDMNANTSPFLPRFMEAYNYYSAVFESLDATSPRDSPDRINVERHCLARDIVNIVACEGAERIERFEVAGKWRARMMMAGFVGCPLTGDVKGAITSLLGSYCDRYKVKEDDGALHFGWEEKILVVASAWR